MSADDLDDEAGVDAYVERHFGLTPEGKPTADKPGSKIESGDQAEDAAIDRYAKTHFPVAVDD